MKKETMFMIGAGVLGFVAVRYFLKNKNKGETIIKLHRNINRFLNVESI
jgi:hypothetical protein